LAKPNIVTILLIVQNEKDGNFYITFPTFEGESYEISLLVKAPGYLDLLTKNIFLDKYSNF